MKIIVGLGNPDEKYQRTYHNLGFIAADAAAEAFGAEFKKKGCKAFIAETFCNGQKIIIAKPQTYMNLSGESVRELVSYYKIDLSDLIVIYDDFDLPKGSVRIRKDGSAGTHNGMRNIVKEIGSTQFARIRVGFNGGADMELIDYVLSGIAKEDFPVYEEATRNAGLAAAEWAKGEPLDKVMQKYNVKK